MIHPKAALIERLQKEGRGQPQFATQREGPDHEPTDFAFERMFLARTTRGCTMSGRTAAFGRIGTS